MSRPRAQCAYCAPPSAAAKGLDQDSSLSHECGLPPPPLRGYEMGASSAAEQERKLKTGSLLPRPPPAQPADVEAKRALADLPPHAELSHEGESGRGIVQHDGAVDAGEEGF